VIIAKFFTDIQVVGSGPCPILATGRVTIVAALATIGLVALRL